MPVPLGTTHDEWVAKRRSLFSYGDAMYMMCHSDGVRAASIESLIDQAQRHIDDLVRLSTHTTTSQDFHR